MKILDENAFGQFVLYTSFQSRFLSPIGQYVNWKLANGEWDDYNELFHATALIEKLQRNPVIWFDTHTLERDQQIIGVLFVVGGNIAALEENLQTPEEKTLLLKYFHIAEKGKGLGSYWLQSVLLPHYLAREYDYIHVNSSHPASFQFYRRFGKQIGNYHRTSDNGKYRRKGASFLIPLPHDEAAKIKN